MFNPDDILYEDNHLLIVNKRCGDLVQPDPSGEISSRTRSRPSSNGATPNPARCSSAWCTASTAR